MQLIIVDHASRISCFFDHFSTPFLVVHLTSIDHLVLMVALGPSSPFTQRNVKPFGFCIPSAHGLVATSVPLQWRHLGAAAVVSIGLSASRSRKVKLETRARSEKLLGVKLTFFPRCCFVISLRLWKQMQADALMMMFSSYFSDKLRPFYVIYV